MKIEFIVYFYLIQVLICIFI